MKLCRFNSGLKETYRYKAFFSLRVSFRKRSSLAIPVDTLALQLLSFSCPSCLKTDIKINVFWLIPGWEQDLVAGPGTNVALSCHGRDTWRPRLPLLGSQEHRVHVDESLTYLVLENPPEARGHFYESYSGSTVGRMGSRLRGGGGIKGISENFSVTLGKQPAQTTTGTRRTHLGKQKHWRWVLDEGSARFPKERPQYWR